MKKDMQNTIIIAEAGVNHNGSLDTAKKLVDAAAESGADYVKFQTFKAESLVSESASLAEYQHNNIGKEACSQYEMLRRLELDERDHLVLVEYCKQRGIKFMSTPFDLESIQFLNSLDLDYWKIPSGQITDYPYLREIARCGGKVMMSTGMCTMDDIANAISVLVCHGIERNNITLLHCNTEYPTPMEDVNLLAMVEMRKVFGLETGFSDHTVGIEVPLAAVALGAVVIEKHFTLDRGMNGPDHAASLEPHELKEMVRSVRNIEYALGQGEKKVTESEKKNIVAARKSIVASKEIRKGEVFCDENLHTKRPGLGISPMRWDEVVGQISTRDYNVDDMIEL